MESWSIVENADYTIVINREVQKSTGKRFLTFKLVKGRGEDTDTTYFNLPFSEANNMRLEQDYGLAERVTVASLASDLAPDFEAIENVKRNARDRKQLNEEEENEESNKVFDLTSYFSKVD